MLAIRIEVRVAGHSTYFRHEPEGKGG